MNKGINMSGRVSPTEKNYLFSALLANDQLLRGAKTVLGVEWLDQQSEPHLIILWRAVTGLIDEKSWPDDPHQRRLALECRCDAVATHAGPVYRQFLGNTMEIIEQAWSGPVLDKVTVVPLLRRFLKERLCYDHTRNIVGSVHPQSTISLGPLFVAPSTNTPENWQVRTLVTGTTSAMRSRSSHFYDAGLFVMPLK